MLDSYPRIFRFGAASPSSVAMHASLSTSTSVAEQVRAIGHAARKLIDISEREALSNGLEEICEAYTEGWEGDMNSSDDDL